MRHEGYAPGVLAVTVPRWMARILGIDFGDYVSLVLEGSSIRLKKAEVKEGASQAPPEAGGG